MQEPIRRRTSREKIRNKIYHKSDFLAMSIQMLEFTCSIVCMFRSGSVFRNFPNLATPFAAFTVTLNPQFAKPLELLPLFANL